MYIRYLIVYVAVVNVILIFYFQIMYLVQLIEHPI